MEEQIHILLIEDNPADVRLIDLYLKEAYGTHFMLTKTNCLSDGLEALLKNTFDVILIDLSLPDSSGLATFTKVHETNSGAPVIVLTGLDDESVGRNAMKLGAQDFLTKGQIKSKELSRSINYSIERTKLHKQLSQYAKKLEEQAENLMTEKKNLSEAQRLAHIGSWKIDGDEITWSNEMYHIFGLHTHETELTFERFFEFIHPEDKAPLKKSIEDSIHSFKPVNLHHRILHSDDSVRILHTKAEVIENKRTGGFCLLGTSQDVTEQLQEEYMGKLVLAATQSFNSVIIRDRAGRIEWVNEGFSKLSGFALEDVKGSFAELLKNGVEKDILIQKDYHNRVLRRKVPITYEGKYYTKSGKPFWTITTLTPILGKDGEVERIMSIDSDITVRKYMEEELLLANKISEHSLMKGNKALNELKIAKKQLEELMKVKEVFLANMSHEIRTPMNAIVGFTNLLLRAGLSPELMQYINAIKTSGENLLVIINDILDFSKIQNGKVAFEEIELNLTSLLSTTHQLFLPKANEKGITLSLQIDKAVPDNLLGDPTRLTQILTNLIGNSIKFTASGTVDIQINLIALTEDAAELKFSVRDTGIGISTGKLASIFEGFIQAENNTTRKFGGTGLGLTIAKQLVELQNGTIHVESQEGKGTIFSFQLTFKINQSTTQPVMPEEEKKDSDRESIENIHILLVEDNQLNQVLATKVLTDWNCKVAVAENGLIALEKLMKNDFDLVLMDIQLPEMDGYEATKKIRTTMPALKSGVPVIAMTAYAMTGEAERCIAAGMNDYISKPFNPQLLYAKISDAVQKAKAIKRAND